MRKAQRAKQRKSLPPEEKKQRRKLKRYAKHLLDKSLNEQFTKLRNEDIARRRICTSRGIDRIRQRQRWLIAQRNIAFSLVALTWAIAITFEILK